MAAEEAEVTEAAAVEEAVGLRRTRRRTRRRSGYEHEAAEAVAEAEAAEAGAVEEVL